MKALKVIVAGFLAIATPSLAHAQSDEWLLGSHPDYHAAMVRDIDGIFVAIFVAKEPTIYGSPLLMETMVPACDTKRPIGMHATEAIMAFEGTAEARLKTVRDTVQSFYETNVKPCPPSEGLEAKLFHRFDDAYLAMDAMLVEAEILPLNPDDDLGLGEPEAEQEDSSE